MARTTLEWEDRIGRRIRLRDIYILSSVVRWGSMAKAASHLGMSQPAVSEAIASLEDALHVKLLDRNSQGVAPTLYADAFLKRSQVVFEELRQSVRDIEYLANPEGGEVRIACPEFLSADLLPRAIGIFSAKHPRVVFSVVQQDTTTLENQELQQRLVDIVLCRIPNKFEDDDLNVEPLLLDPHRITVGTSSPWARKRKIELVELAGEQWILPPSPLVVNLLQAEFEARGVSAINITVNAASLLLRNELLSTGRYLAVMPESLLNRHAKHWSLKALNVDAYISPPPVSLVTLKRRALSPVVLSFVETLREVAREGGPPIAVRGRSG
jgi:DNA-binding transcriptional LysR family regulator